MKNLHGGLLNEKGRAMMGSNLSMILMNIRQKDRYYDVEREYKVPIVKENRKGITYKKG